VTMQALSPNASDFFNNLLEESNPYPKG